MNFLKCPKCGTKNVYWKWKPNGESLYSCRYRFNSGRRPPCGFWVFDNPDASDVEGQENMKALVKINPEELYDQSSSG